jgi:hypothetical protein
MAVKARLGVTFADKARMTPCCKGPLNLIAFLTKGLFMATYLLLDLSEAYVQLDQLCVILPADADPEHLMSTLVDNFASHQCGEDCDCVSDLLDWISTDTRLHVDEDDDANSCDKVNAIYELFYGALSEIQSTLIEVNPYDGGDAVWSYVQRRNKHAALLVRNETTCT